MQSLIQQFLRDLKVSWQKTALLSVLCVVGMFLWIPPLVRAFVGHSERAVELAEAPVATDQFGAKQESATNDEQPVTYDWQKIDQLEQVDPLVRSAELTTVHRNPFQFDFDQFPPPVEFAEEERLPLEDATAYSSTADVGSNGLTLESTIVGKTRRAALINGKLYLEKSEIRVNGVAFRLAEISHRRVRLVHGEQVLELTLRQRFHQTKPQPPIGHSTIPVTDDRN